jgi:hypothetical protein
MPDVWDAAVYRQRAEAWRKRATELPYNPAEQMGRPQMAS